MTDRYTRKDAEMAAQRLADALGKPWGHYTNDAAHPHRNAEELRDGFYTIPGGWALDHNPTYGGCVIEEIMSDGGTGISHPFGGTRCAPREFVAKVSFALTALSLRAAS